MNPLLPEEHPSEEQDEVGEEDKCSEETDNFGEIIKKTMVDSATA